MKILILGANGQLGCCLRDQFEKSYHECIYASRSNIDIGELSEVEKKIGIVNPDIIINTAAYTSVDNAEDDWLSANLINNSAVGELAKVCFRANIFLIHISTDYVFDGTGSKPYIETDLTTPLGSYGKSKRLGEIAIENSGCEFIILRTSWLFSEYSNNFLTTMLRLVKNNKHLQVVGDQYGTPTYAQELAAGIVSLANQAASEIHESGIYHFCGEEQLSWYDFAVRIFERAERFSIVGPDTITKIASSEYPTRAKRPAFSALDSSLFRMKFFPKQKGLDDNIDCAIIAIMR